MFLKNQKKKSSKNCTKNALKFHIHKLGIKKNPPIKKFTENCQTKKLG